MFQAVKIMDTFISFMSLGLNNIIYSFNPDVIIINSRITNEINGIIEKNQGKPKPTAKKFVAH